MHTSWDPYTNITTNGQHTLHGTQKGNKMSVTNRHHNKSAARLKKLIVIVLKTT